MVLVVRARGGVVGGALLLLLLHARIALGAVAVGHPVHHTVGPRRVGLVLVTRVVWATTAPESVA